MVFPTSNLPTASVPWGREVEKQLSTVVTTVKSNELNNAARDNQLSSALTRLAAAQKKAEDAFTATGIVSGQVDALETNVTTLEGNVYFPGTTTINGGNIRTGTIGATQISSSYVYAGSISAGQISAGTIYGVSISGGSLSTTGSTNISISGTSVFFNAGGSNVGSLYGTSNQSGKTAIIASTNLFAVIGELGVYDSVLNLSNTSLYSANAGRTLIAQGGTIYPTTTTATSTPVHQSSSGAQLTRSTSSRRYKLFEEEIDTGLGILNLVPKTWIDKNEYEDNENSIEGLGRYVGFIAEDLDDAGFELFVYHNPDGSAESIDYGRLVAAVIPVLKLQQEKIQQLEIEINNLKGA